MATINTDIAQQIDITARAKNSFNLELQVSNTNGAALDLTGYNVYLEIKSIAGNLLKGFTNNNSSPYNNDGTLYNVNAVSLTAASGIINISENAAGMDLSKGSYKYSVKLESGTNQIKTWMFGKFKINDD